jgi:RNA-directed DNA polymerase
LIEESRLFENLSSSFYLGIGFELVRRNRGAPGIDGVSIQDFAANLDEELSQLQQES